MARDPALGDVLVVLAQLFAAAQFIVEEKYLAKYQVPALLAVGLEVRSRRALAFPWRYRLLRPSTPDTATQTDAVSALP